MHYKVVLILTVCSSLALAGLENNGRGARPIALGNAFVALADDQWATLYNPAGLTRVPTSRVALFFIPDQFGLKELRTISAAAAVPFGFASAGIVLEQFGFDLYRETTLAIGGGAAIDQMIAAGMTINLVRVAIDRYGATTNPTIDLGVMVNVGEDVRLGFDWKNISATTLGAIKESLPQVQSIGISYELTKQARICLELEKDIRFPFITKLGFEQQLFNMLDFRFGLSNNPGKFSLGVGASALNIEFSYAGYTHPQLGWSHQIEISFQL